MRFFSVQLEEQMSKLATTNESNWFVAHGGGGEDQFARLTPSNLLLLDSSSPSPSFSLFLQLRPLGLFALAIGTCFCIFANFLTLILLLRCRPLQRSSRTTNLYVLSLCLADLGVGCVAMPLALAQQWLNALHPLWLCQAWQLADLLFSTVSLYSICAIALDRVWNLEQPLRVFTRSRRRAKRLMVCIWLLPLLIWLPVYALLHGPNEVGGCFPPRDVAKRVYWVALPALYIPAAILIGLFLRISLVVHRHLKFLRQHSSLPQLVGQSTTASHFVHSSPSMQPPICYQNGKQPPLPQTSQALLRTPGSASPCQKFRTAKTIEGISTAAAAGMNGGGFLESSPKSISPLMRLNGGRRIWRERAATSEEVMVQWRNSPTILVHAEAEEEEEAERGKEAEGEQQRGSTLVMSLHQKVSLCSRPSTGSPPSGVEDDDDSSLSSGAKKECLLRKLSASFLARRGSSSRFSMVALSENLAELLQREGISQQVKAAKAVGLILCCFLLCWFPFLLVWPIRLFSPETVSDRTFRLCLWLNYACSTFNPLLYALSNPKVRAAFTGHVLGCKFARKDAGGSGKNTRRSNTGVFV